METESNPEQGDNDEQQSKNQSMFRIRPKLFKQKSRTLNSSFPSRENYNFNDLNEILLWYQNENLLKIKFIENNLLDSIPPIRSRAKSSGPKVLLCHDYKFNYQERKVDNMEECHPLSVQMQFYTFLYWSLIDIFVYFTHDLLTIPPPEWTTACHQNGVACFGTFMIEHWTEYCFQEQKLNGQTLLEKILENKQSIDEFVQAMKKFQYIYKFDGWLINIETPIKPNMIENLIYFLQNLKNQIKTLKNSEQSIQIVWYDSVTIDGKLQWQNELNESNAQFFQNSDAIFLNYCWKPEKLQKNIEIIEKNPQWNRSKYDIFVGVDCYGRGCFGGGGLQTYQAVEKILENDLSVAIFAPGWTHESKLNCDNNNFLKKFFTKIITMNHNNREKTMEIYSLDDEYRFWLPIVMKGGLLKCERFLSTLPLYTSFNVGYGFDYKLIGRSFPFNNLTKANRRWLNFEHLELQPSFFEQQQNNQYKLSITFNCPFNGGSSLQLNCFDCSSIANNDILITLFRTKIPINLKNNWQYIHQIAFKHQNNSNSNDNTFDKWIYDNLRFKTIIDFHIENCELTQQTLESEDFNSKIMCFILNGNNESTLCCCDNCETKQQINNNGNTSSKSIIHYETFHLNGWRIQQSIIDLNNFLKNICCPFKNEKIILSKFKLQPYFQNNNNNLITNQSNPIIINIGEFYFNHFDPNQNDNSWC